MPSRLSPRVFRTCASWSITARSRRFATAARAGKSGQTASRGLPRLPHVHCKLSGLATEAAPGWTEATLQPYVDHLLQSFGPARLMWGSDWPVLNLNGDYLLWHSVANTLLAALSDRSARRFSARTPPRSIVCEDDAPSPEADVTPQCKC